VSGPDDLEPFLDKDYRDAYLDGHVKGSIAYQIFQLRKNLDLNQSQFGALISQPQTVVSRLENTEYGAVTVNTLIKIAQGLGIGLEIRFCDYPHLIESGVSPQDFAVDTVQQSYRKLADKASRPGARPEGAKPPFVTGAPSAPVRKPPAKRARGVSRT
jgi:transcriptional regulator with XRE-family HTH domain